jgi:hypothetical protein
MSTKTLRPAKTERDAIRESTIVKEIRFIGWTLGILMLGVVALVLAEAILVGHEGLITDIINAISVNKIAFALIFATGSGLSFGTSAIIKENPQKKKEAFRNYVLSMVLLEIFAIFAVAVVYPIPF